MARGAPRWQAEGGAGVGGNEVGRGLRHCLGLDLRHGHGLSLGCGLGRGHDGRLHGPGGQKGELAVVGRKRLSSEQVEASAGLFSWSANLLLLDLIS